MIRAFAYYSALIWTCAWIDSMARSVNRFGPYISFLLMSRANNMYGKSSEASRGRKAGSSLWSPGKQLHKKQRRVCMIPQAYAPRYNGTSDSALWKIGAPLKFGRNLFLRPGRRRLLYVSSDVITKSPSLPLMPDIFHGPIFYPWVFTHFYMLIELSSYNFGISVAILKISKAFPVEWCFVRKLIDKFLPSDQMLSI